MIDTDTLQRLRETCPDLAAQIARCAEQAYRRGYQQGALYGHGLDREVCGWRFGWPRGMVPSEHSDEERYSIAIAPPDRRDLGLHPGLKKPKDGGTYGHTCTALERLRMEASTCSELIQRLANEELKSTVPFGVWLHRYKGDGPVGDLRDDFRLDCQMERIHPAAITTPEEARWRLMSSGACREALDALNEAAELFEADLEGKQ